MYSQLFCFVLFFCGKADLFDCWHPCIQEQLYLGQQTPRHVSTTRMRLVYISLSTLDRPLS